MSASRGSSKKVSYQEVVLDEPPPVHVDDYNSDVDRARIADGTLPSHGSADVDDTGDPPSPGTGEVDKTRRVAVTRSFKKPHHDPHTISK